MKKLLVALTIASTINTANAMSSIKYVLTPKSTEYQQGYNQGYRRGKDKAYDNVARTVFFVGTAVVAGVIIYQLGKQSRWGVNENGVTYRF